MNVTSVSHLLTLNKIASNVTQIGHKQAQKVGHEKLLGVSTHICVLKKVIIDHPTSIFDT